MQRALRAGACAVALLLAGCTTSSHWALPTAPTAPDGIRIRLFVLDGVLGQIDILEPPAESIQQVIRPGEYVDDLLVADNGHLFVSPGKGPLLEYLAPYRVPSARIEVPAPFATSGMLEQQGGPLFLFGSPEPVPTDVLVYSPPYGASLPHTIDLGQSIQAEAIGPRGWLYVLECCDRANDSMVAVIPPPYRKPLQILAHFPGLCAFVQVDSGRGIYVERGDRRGSYLYYEPWPYRNRPTKVSRLGGFPWAWNAERQLFVLTNGPQILVYAPPYTQLSSAIELPTLPAHTTAVQAAFDADDDLFVLLEGCSDCTSLEHIRQTYGLLEYKPPYNRVTWEFGLRPDAGNDASIQIAVYPPLAEP